METVTQEEQSTNMQRQQPSARAIDRLTPRDEAPETSDVGLSWEDEQPATPALPANELRRSSETPQDESSRQDRLEERIQQLEWKLAVMSRLLPKPTASDRSVSPTPYEQQQPAIPLMTPPRTKRVVEPTDSIGKNRVRRSQTANSTPPLESPAPLSTCAKYEPSVAPTGLPLERNDWEPHQGDRYDSVASSKHACSGAHEPHPLLTTPPLQEEDEDRSSETLSPSKRTRNLSLTLLFEGNEEEYKKRSSAPAAQASMTATERQWLLPNLRQFQQEMAAEEEETPKREALASLDDKVRNKWLDYLNSFQESAPDVDVQMEEFIKVPAGVEKIMAFGFYICIDSFLYMVTILPIRFVWSACLLLVRLLNGLLSPAKSLNPNFQFHRRHLYQLIQVSILYTVYRYVLAEISIGKLYHWIRGQAMIKLYVLIAMVEVFDRLFSSLGQDCLDSMYWNTVSRPRSSRMLISVVVVLVYSSLHALILLVHAETLNVAMNSADQALLTLLISGNFAEIKSTVFKKYNKAALFKITASDICERFKLALFLSLVLLLNVCQGGLDRGQFVDFLRICGYVSGAEFLSDWIKHAFITKFNFLPASVYTGYALLLAGDVTGFGHEGVNFDHSHAVVKRIGFAQIPLLCVMFRLLREAAKYAAITAQTPKSQSFKVLVVCVLWSFLLAIKLALGRLLQRISQSMLHAAPEFSQLTPPMNKNKSKKIL